MFLPFHSTHRLPSPVSRSLHLCRALSAALLAWCVCGVAAAAVPSADRFDLLQSQDKRVASVAYRLAVANASLCKATASPQLGLVLHGLGQYGPHDRDAAARRFGLGDQVGVMALVSGSPAEKAGMVSGDQLLAIDGRPLDMPGVGVALDQASVDRVQSALISALRHGAISLTVSSASGEHDVRFAAELGCPSDVQMVTGTDINAWADGSRVMIGEGLLQHCATDADLALVIGHEMAHNLLGHRRRLAAEGISVSGLLPLGATASRAVRRTEEEADRFAVTLVTTAHFDVSGVARFIGNLIGSGAPQGTSHPDLLRRVALLNAAIASTRHIETLVVVSDGPKGWRL